MIQHLILTRNNKRIVVVLEYTAHEYGISEQSFWSCWLAHKKHIQGDGDTLEEAIEVMLLSMEYHANMQLASEELRKHFQDSMAGHLGIRCPVVG